jgi:hypothetical protein
MTDDAERLDQIKTILFENRRQLLAIQVHEAPAQLSQKLVPPKPCSLKTVRAPMIVAPARAKLTAWVPIRIRLQGHATVRIPRTLATEYFLASTSSKYSWFRLSVANVGYCKVDHPGKASHRLRRAFQPPSLRLSPN